MKTTAFVLLLAMVLNACAPAVPTPTPTPTPIPPTSTPIPPTVPASPTQSAFENLLVYDIPDMYQVTVKAAKFQTLHEPPELLTMDVYYPPNWKSDSPLPAVIFANAFSLKSQYGNCGRSCWTYPSWGRLIAANGLIAIAYDSLYPNDLEAVVKQVQANGADLGIDGNHLGVMGWSSNAVMAEAFAYQENRAYVKFGVFYYGYVLTPDNFRRGEITDFCKGIDCYTELPDVKQIRADLPVLAVSCRLDTFSLNGETLDHFRSLAEKAGAPLTFISYDRGAHGFDTLEANMGGVDDQAVEIVKQTVEFIKANASKK